MVSTIPKVLIKDLGLISYKEAWDYQQQLLKEVIARKRAEGYDPSEQVSYLLICQHPPVYTLGKSGSIDNLLLSEEELKDNGIEFFKINRGGDITHHGPGQIVVYPIFDLEQFFTDVHKYVRFLEETVIRTLAEYDIEGSRIEGFTGVWLQGTDYLPQRKICAIGVHLSRWVSMHGLAFNVQNDLGLFNHIIPCGIEDDNKVVTSLSVEKKSEITVDEIKPRLIHHFKELFKFEIVE